MSKFILLAAIALLAMAAAVFALVLYMPEACSPPDVTPGDGSPAVTKTYPIVEDTFEAGSLDTTRWVVTRKHDFNVSAVKVVNVGTEEAPDGRLGMTADTMETDDKTVKFHGVRSAEPIDFSEGATLEVTLDWNKQPNGMYLTAGLYLCPTATDGNPADEPDWVRLEYLGVQPGRNGRAAVFARRDGGLPRFAYTEGFPSARPKDYTGRPIGVQKIVVRIDPKELLIRENEKKLFAMNPHGLGFTKAYLYLQMSSHSNYRARTIYFDSVRVSSGRSGR